MIGAILKFLTIHIYIYVPMYQYEKRQLLQLAFQKKWATDEGTRCEIRDFISEKQNLKSIINILLRFVICIAVKASLLNV